MQIVDRLLDAPCYIIEVLPQQVPKDCGGQFFAVEDYLLKHRGRYGMSDRLVRIILKAMCYYPVVVYWGDWIEQPTPEQVVEIIDTIIENHSGNMNMVFTNKDALVEFGGDCLNMSIYNPDEEMCVLFEKIATSEGMFWRKAD